MYKRLRQKIKEHEKDIIIGGLYFSLLGVTIYAAKLHQQKVESHNALSHIIGAIDAGLIPRINWDTRMMTFSDPQ